VGVTKVSCGGWDEPGWLGSAGGPVFNTEDTEFFAFSWFFTNLASRVGQAKRTHALVIEVAPAAWVRFA